MKQKGLHVDTPATYEIQVQGALDPEWSGRLQGLGIIVKEFSYKLPVTVLFGRLKDQAALLGVLNALFTLQLPLLMVCCSRYG
jgi:hypothetical protein